MISQKTYIIGSTGTALNIIEQISDARKKHGMDIRLSGIVIDTLKAGEIISGIPVTGGLKDIPILLKDTESRFIFALYKPEKMRERHELLKSLGIPKGRFINFIHPLAYIAGSVKMGYGNIVLSHTTVQSDVVIGNCNIINSNVTIEHGTVIGDANFVASGTVIGANVKIVKRCFLGLNSSVRENVVLDEVFVGMGAVVIDDFSDCRVMGVPAGKF